MVANYNPTTSHFEKHIAVFNTHIIYMDNHSVRNWYFSCSFFELSLPFHPLFPTQPILQTFNYTCGTCLSSQYPQKCWSYDLLHGVSFMNSNTDPHGYPSCEALRFTQDDERRFRLPTRRRLPQCSALGYNCSFICLTQRVYSYIVLLCMTSYNLCFSSHVFLLMYFYISISLYLISIYSLSFCYLSLRPTEWSHQGTRQNDSHGW